MTRAALIIGHGQPGDPDPAEADMRALARTVAAHLPGWHVLGATLAAPGALEAALAELPAPLIVPFFIADGIFTRQILPRLLQAAGAGDLPRLGPFGLWPDTAALGVQSLREAADSAGWPESATQVLLAAHGSARGPRAAEGARLLQARIRAATRLAGDRLGLIEEPPFLADAARDLGPQSLCLPLFVARGDHVRDDLPAALAAAGFRGRLLDPLGCHPGVPALLARSITEHGR